MECEEETIQKIISEKKEKTNNPPEANPDKLIFLPDEEVPIDKDSVLLNDLDRDGDELQILIYKTVYGGLLQLNDGSYNYIPTSEIEYSSDTAYYILSDGYDSDSSYIVLNKLEVGTDLAEVIDINPIYFDSNSSEIREDAQNELEKIAETIKEKIKKIKDIPITINTGQLLEASAIDSHAKMKYEKILQIEKDTSGFNQEEFLAKKRNLTENRDRLRQIDQEFGAISNRIENAEQQLEKNKTVLDELDKVRKYVLELENIQKNVYSVDGPVAKSLRSWALEVISEKASEYLEKLDFKSF